MHQKYIFTSGKEQNENSKVLIMLHGRGSNAKDILSLAGLLDVGEFSLVAPQATNNTWYPYSFMAPLQRNEPWLSSALQLIKGIVADLDRKEIPSRQIYFLGFSQGACLLLEFVARNATGYGGIVAFTGGLIGDRIYPENYKGDFKGTPIFIGTSNPDFHVPVERVYATTNILKEMGADVTEKIYNNIGHTIIDDEIRLANDIVFKK